jgi:hypothetical protein
MVALGGLEQPFAEAPSHLGVAVMNVLLHLASLHTTWVATAGDL